MNNKKANKKITKKDSRGHKFLVALDESESAFRIANYLETLLSADDEVTLFNVLPNPAVMYNFNDPSISPVFLENKDFFVEFENLQKDMINKIMEKAKKILTKSGISKDRIKIKTAVQNLTIPHHILDEAVKGKYNTIVIGKHNSSRITGIILGDVTARVMHSSKGIPVIVV